MSESKPTGSSDNTESGGRAPRVAGRLSDRAPPKPRRPGSSIPPALIASKPAEKIRPAPRPPRPPAHQPPVPDAAQESFRHYSIHQSERPVVAAVATTGKQSTGPGQRSSPLVLLAAAAALGGLLWYGQTSSTASEHELTGPLPEAAADANQQPRSATNSVREDESATKALRTIDLDELEASERAQTPTRAPAGLVPEAAAPVPVEQAAGSRIANEKSEGVPASDEPTRTAVPQNAEPSTEAEPATGTPAETDNSAATAAQLPPFDEQAAKLAIGASASQASSCRKGDDERGTAEVLITFAPSGRVTSANVTGEPFGGTQTGGCIAATMRNATIPPFAGEHVTVRKLIKVY